MLKKIKAFINTHIVADFPYPDACFDCNKGDCKHCKMTEPNFCEQVGKCDECPYSSKCGRPE